MKTKNSQKLFSVSITHNSKIRELSDGNKKLKTELWLAKQTFFFRIEMGPTIFENWFMEIENWEMRIDEPNGPLEP